MHSLSRVQGSACKAAHWRIRPSLEAQAVLPEEGLLAPVGAHQRRRRIRRLKLLHGRRSRRALAGRPCSRQAGTAWRSGVQQAGRRCAATTAAAGTAATAGRSPLCSPCAASTTPAAALPPCAPGRQSPCTAGCHAPGAAGSGARRPPAQTGRPGPPPVHPRAGPGQAGRGGRAGGAKRAGGGVASGSATLRRWCQDRVVASREPVTRKAPAAAASQRGAPRRAAWRRAPPRRARRRTHSRTTRPPGRRQTRLQRRRAGRQCRAAGYSRPAAPTMPQIAPNQHPSTHPPSRALA